MSSFSRSAQQWATFARSWFLIDARMQPVGKIAALCSVHLQGKHKPIYHPLSDIGDHVVVMNTKHIAFSGNKWEQKVYSSHTGYPGSFKQVTAAQMHQKDQTARQSEPIRSRGTQAADPEWVFFCGMQLKKYSVFAAPWPRKSQLGFIPCRPTSSPAFCSFSVINKMNARLGLSYSSRGGNVSGIIVDNDQRKVKEW
ncbi:39S ribosomal protein L13, mitochondrial isoform X2 [Puntigrus tetrazona]|uniref:39S ribosomal protein L13, mitochondrial isoform X2 n=1 Tax=Puntigrus tetrazona TaxID=1606681 RepID=UPI001C8986DE|nr:39S ribosomal protein L13, mitochondrial isoform X2 [Puntigrus tetrazona]